MATQLLTPEAIALTEKKMDMTLDEIIKMSKNPAKKDKRATHYPVKGQGSINGIASQHGNKTQRFIASRPAIIQGVLAQKRSNFQGNGNQFPLANNAAKRAAVTQTRNINFVPGRNSSGSWKNKQWAAPVNTWRNTADDLIVIKEMQDTNMEQQMQQKPRTMDALFADLKEERTMMVFSSQPQPFRDYSRQRFGGRQQLQQQTRSGSFRSGAFSVHRFVNISNNHSR